MFRADFVNFTLKTLLVSPNLLARRKQYRFRKSPKNYLTTLEEKLIKERLLL